ncbi:MAG: DUF3604 domain-containing protein, partial [Parahaliea sp.]
MNSISQLVRPIVKGVTFGAVVLLQMDGLAAEPRLLWGDTHVHSSYSPDAFFMGNHSATPDVAYRWAKGLPVVHPYTGTLVRIKTPLDFLIVTDHAEMLGVPYELAQGNPLISDSAEGRRWSEMLKEGKGRELFRSSFAKAIVTRKPIADFDGDDFRRSLWQRVIEHAEAHNEPGEFSALIGWEWSSSPDRANLHRVIFTANGADVASQFLPFSSLDSDRPEQLWQWLDSTAVRTGADFIAIPHNSNISDGKMFPVVDSDGRAMTLKYAKMRAQWEPVVEITQFKGDSETHPLLSPDDSFAGFESYSHLLGGGSPSEDPRSLRGSYVRGALLRGLELEAKVGINPYAFGIIGSTDSHTGLSSAEEDNFWGKFAIDSIPANKTKEVITGVNGTM